MKKRIFRCVIISATIFLVILGWNLCENQDDWQNAYRRVLLSKQLADGTELDVCYFALFDFDEDGVPELLLPGGKEAYVIGGMDGAWDVWGDTYSILRYNNGEVERIYFDEAYGVNVSYEIETRNLLINCPNGQGMPAVLYEYEDGEFNELAYAYGGKDGLMVHSDRENLDNYYVIEEYFNSDDAIAGENQSFFYYEITNQNIRDIVLNYE